MKHCVIDNIPKDPREIMDYALSKSYDFWVDEKATKKHPSYSQRKRSDLTFEQAYEIILNNKPQWTMYFRNISYVSKKEKDYWEFGGNVKIMFDN